jgi:hypothetical protein
MNARLVIEIPLVVKGLYIVQVMFCKDHFNPVRVAAEQRRCAAF